MIAFDKGKTSCESLHSHLLLLAIFYLIYYSMYSELNASSRPPALLLIDCIFCYGSTEKYDGGPPECVW